MELVEGEDLSDRIVRGAVPVDEAVRIATQIAEALEAAHEQGIVHRDLKPANIKLRPDGTVKVLDFGLAKAWDADSADHSLSMSPTLTAHATAAGVILGTAAYMAPEQAAGTAADRRADIWAFGVVLWEMLTGNKLFEGETVSHVLAAVLKDEPDLEKLPNHVAPRLRELVGRCLRKQPTRRLQAIGDARVLLEDYSADPEAQTADSHTTAHVEPTRPPWRWVVPALVGLAAAIVAAGWLAGRSEPLEARVVRFNLESAPGTGFHLDPAAPGIVSVSPNGRLLGYTARNDEDGVVALYVRALDEARPRRLQGTEGAQYPFWSPDSRSLGFFADGRLKKVEISGAPPVVLCDAGNGKGGSWSPEGLIVFAPSYDSPIHVVAAAGGESTPVTAFDTERGDNSHRHPRFLPDGRRFIYLARTGGGQASTGHPLVVNSIDGDEDVEIMAGIAHADFAAGHLLFTRQSSLMARRFDPESLEFLGEAVPFGQDILVLPGAAVAAFSAGADTLAFHSSAGEMGATLTWFDRTGTELETLGTPGDFNEVFVSPGGSMVAVGIGNETSGAADIWVYEIDRNMANRLTFDPGDEQQIVWSPDERYIAFGRADGGTVNIYRKMVGGAGAAELLLDSELDTYPTSWHPDGSMMGFDAESPDTSWDQWVLPLDGGEPYPFLNAPYREVNGVFSPDGRWMAYGSNESGRDEIYITPFPGPGRKWRVSQDGGRFAMWSADGREIFFEGVNGAVTRVQVDLDAGSVEIGAPEVLFDTPNTGLSYPFSVSRDGQKFVVVTPQAGPEALGVVLDWTAELEAPQ
jgi:Tol biopolymer transport system component